MEKCLFKETFKVFTCFSSIHQEIDAIGFDPMASHCILYDFPTDNGNWSYLIRTAEGPTEKEISMVRYNSINVCSDNWP